MRSFRPFTVAIALAIVFAAAWSVDATRPRPREEYDRPSAASPLFRQQLTDKLREMDGLPAAGELLRRPAPPQQQAIVFVSAGLSACVASGCVFSGCAASACAGSGCAASGCGGSACGGSACAGSVCGGSACAGSACPGSVCAGSACAGSVCGGSACGGSACGGSVCAGSVCGGSACGGSVCGGSACGVSGCAGSLCGQSGCAGSLCGQSACAGSACAGCRTAALPNGGPALVCRMGDQHGNGPRLVGLEASRQNAGTSVQWIAGGEHAGAFRLYRKRGNARQLVGAGVFAPGRMMRLADPVSGANEYVLELSDWQGRSSRVAFATTM